MRKLVVLLWMIVLTMGLSAQQFSWPPRTYPMSVPCNASVEVSYYLGTPKVTCIGKGNGGYKFRISGVGKHDLTSTNMDMFYIVPNNRIVTAGSYFFPQITEGQKYSFEIVSAFSGYTPSGFKGFFIHDKWLTVPKESVPETTDTTTTSPAPAATGPSRYPAYVGGQTAMKKFFADNANPRKPAIATAGYGEVIVQFTVTETGEIENADWKGRVSVSMDEEALRLVNMMPKWNPGLINGQPTKMKVQVGLRFFPNQEFRYIKTIF